MFFFQGATLRSSVPSLTGSEADWTLSIFLLFMLLTGAVVYSAYQEAARKRLTGRNRLRQISGGYGSAGKKQSISFFSGTGFVDFLYAMMGSTGGGGGAGEWDDTKDSVADASTEKAATGAVGVSSASAGHSGGGASKKRGGAKDTSASSSHADTAATSSAPGVRKTTLLGDFLALLASNTGSTGSMSTGAADSKTGDLFTAVASSVPSAAKVANGSSNGTGHGNGKSMALATATDGSAVTASVSAGTNGGGGAKGVHKHPDANPAQSSAGGKGKNKKGVHPTKVVVQPAPVVPVPAAAASTSNGKKIVSSDSHTSLTSIASTSSDGDSTTAAAAHSAEVFVPPVTLNNRRVSYAGLIDPALLSGGGDGAAGEDSDWQGAGQGDWAEARKKGSKKHSAGAAGGADDTAGGAARPDRISLALKDSPLYRHAPARAPPPAPAAPTAPAPTVSARPGASVAAGEGAWGNGKRPAGTVNSAPSTAGNSSQLQSGVQGQQGQQGGSVSTTSVPQQYGGVASVGGGAGGSGRLGLSEAMKLAELGNLSFNPSPSASAGQAAGPPGLPRSALPSPSVALQSPSAQQPPQKQQFGFSRFDILASSAAANASSASALAAAAAAEASNSRASTQTSTTTTTASVNGGSGSSLSPMGASLFAANRNGNGGVYGGASAAGAGANGLYDLVGYLDNANGSSRTGTAAGAAATATYTSGTASTSTAASLGTTYYNGTLYGDYSSSTNGLYPSGGQATDDVSGSDAYDMLDDHYYDAYSAGGNSTYLQQYGGSGGSTAAASNYQGQQQQLDYNASQSSHFGFYTSTAHAANAGRSSWADAPRYSSGTVVGEFHIVITYIYV